MQPGSFNHPFTVNGAVRGSSVRAATRKALYQFTKGPDTRIIPTEEICESKDAAVTKILERRRQHSV